MLAHTHTPSIEPEGAEYTEPARHCKTAQSGKQGREKEKGKGERERQRQEEKGRGRERDGPSTELTRDGQHQRAHALRNDCANMNTHTVTLTQEKNGTHREQESANFL